MAYVPVPKDLTTVKTKVLFNLTKRQLICFSAGGLAGIPVFFLLREPAGTSTAAMLMMLIMMPFFMFAIFEKNGRPLEKILSDMIQVTMIRPKQRPYQTNNFYDALQRQEALDKEVAEIVRGTHTKAAPAGRVQERRTRTVGKDKQKTFPG